MDLVQKDEHWAKVWELFNSAYEKAPGQRSALLSSDGLDPEIRSEVIALLEVSDSCTAGRLGPASPVEGPEYSVGHAFGRYLIVGLIGQGGFGRIYAAHDRELQRIVALKVLAGPVSGHRERLIEEARAATALNHPNIVTVYETLTADDRLAIVMEFVDGVSLRQLLGDSVAPLPFEKVVRYGRQLAEALTAAHQAGITHRDVKPENILVRKDEYVKLVDFGLATHVVPATPDSDAGTFAGTWRYMAPEQIRGDAVSPATDVFSLGLVLYEMTTGTHPFAGNSPLDTAGAILKQEPVAPSRKVRGIPPSLDRLIVSMLAKDPGARPPTAEVVRYLEKLAGESERRSYRRLAWLAGAIVAAAAAATLAISIWPRKPAPMVLRLDAKPLTGDEGRERLPAISPDGRFVIYVRQPTAGSPRITLLREVGSDRKTVLPFDWPYTWLPDAQHIGFVRRGKNNEDTLCTTGMDGKGEQEILHAQKMGMAGWSPDGEWIVYVAGTGKNQGTPALFRYSTRTRETRQLTFPIDSTLGEDQFAISPDGKEVAFRRLFTYLNGDIFLVNLHDPGPPRRVTFERVAGDSLAWVGPRAIVSSLIRGANNSLWLYPLGSNEATTRLTEVGIEATNVQSALKRNRLAWVSALDDTNIWSVPLSGGTPRRIISSAMRDLDVATSSLGLLAFRSDRSGAPEIWISTKDGSTQKRVTNLNRRSGSPRWSPDGRRVVFDSHGIDDASDIYVMDCDPAQLQCGSPVRITDNPASDAIPNWTADGSSVYFASQRTGQWQLWKVPATGKLQQPVQMTTKGGFFAMESPDGKWLYYSRVDSKPVKGVWRKALPGNSGATYNADDPGEMVVPLEQRSLATWVLAAHEILYSTFGDEGTPAALWAFNMETHRKRVFHKGGEAPLARGLSVAQDGTFVFFSQLDRWQSNIVVADYEIVK